jgi:GWxTD domain-containing protein
VLLPGPRVVPVDWSPAATASLTDSLRFARSESRAPSPSPRQLPLGELLVSGLGDTTVSAALVSFSSSWVVTNFEDMLSLLRYFPPSPALDSLRKAEPGERGIMWKAFWKATDPNPGTTSNEALDRYVRRVALANVRFRDEGIAGWKTDRGEVFIRLGEPDEIFDASPQSEGPPDPVGVYPVPARDLLPR